MVLATEVIITQPSNSLPIMEPETLLLCSKAPINGFPLRTAIIILQFVS
jgi:hypothetical protein